jgi:hypothetical protein
VEHLNAFASRGEKEVLMNTLRNKFTAIGLAGAVGFGTLAIPPVPAAAAPVAPSQNSVKQSAPQQTEDVRWRRRHYGPAIALGVFGAVAAGIAAHQYQRRYYRHYYDPYYPAYYGAPYYYGPRYYYGPPRYYYGW